MYRIEHGDVIIDALMIQPTNWCGSNCKNCYVKEHEHGEQIDLREMYRLFSHFYDSDWHWANQISISVDDLPWACTGDNKLNEMTFFIRSCLEQVLEDTRRCKPEVHIACRSPATLADYRNYHGVPVPLSLFGQCDVISFSEVTPEGESIINRLRLNGATIVHNILTSNVRKAVEEARSSADIVDEHHFTIDKCTPPDLGNFLSAIKHIWGTTDRCTSAVRFGTCGANRGVFHIWPDGSVSGCPYKIKSDTDPANPPYSSGILDNIVKASKVEDPMAGCPLQETLK